MNLFFSSLKFINMLAVYYNLKNNLQHIKPTLQSDYTHIDVAKKRRHEKERKLEW